MLEKEFTTMKQKDFAVRFGRGALAGALALVMPAMAFAQATDAPATPRKADSWVQRVADVYGPDYAAQHSEEIEYFLSLDQQERTQLLQHDPNFPAILAFVAANTPGLAAVAAVTLVPLMDKPGAEAVSVDANGKHLLD
jgi:hypothetical protein